MTLKHTQAANGRLKRLSDIAHQTADLRRERDTLIRDLDNWPDELRPSRHKIARAAGMTYARVTQIINEGIDSAA